MSPSDTLRMVGEALYGPRWQSDLAADLNVSDRTMRRWVAGSELPRVDVVKDLAVLVQKRTGRLGEVGGALMHVPLIQWRATGPKVPRGEERENESRPVLFGGDGEADFDAVNPTPGHRVPYGG